jgi:serine/threonine protein kinase
MERTLHDQLGEPEGMSELVCVSGHAHTTPITAPSRPRPRQPLPSRGPAHGSPAQEAKLLVLQLALGLAHLHAHGTLHRDLKPSNVLLSGRGADLTAKLCDFGAAASRLQPQLHARCMPPSSGAAQRATVAVPTARRLCAPLQPQRGRPRAHEQLCGHAVGWHGSAVSCAPPPLEFASKPSAQPSRGHIAGLTRSPPSPRSWYRAPEVLLSDAYGPPADVWAMGCTLAELSTGLPLLPGTSSLDQLARIMRCCGPLPPSLALVLAGNPGFSPLRGARPHGRSLAERMPVRSWG